MIDVRFAFPPSQPETFARDSAEARLRQSLIFIDFPCGLVSGWPGRGGEGASPMPPCLAEIRTELSKRRRPIPDEAASSPEREGELATSRSEDYIMRSARRSHGSTLGGFAPWRRVTPGVAHDLVFAPAHPSSIAKGERRHLDPVRRVPYTPIVVVHDRGE